MSLTKAALLLFLLCASAVLRSEERPRIREFGIRTGTLAPGPQNAITDVPGVKVGQVTLIQGESVRTGVTAILPHAGNVFQDKVPAAVHVANGFGKLAGSTQVEELGCLETPIILTNTLSVPTAADALIDYVLSLPGNEKVQSVNPVVGETNDGFLNDIRGRHVKKEHILQAIGNASSGPVEEGAVGAGTGTMCFNFKGGIGTSSRRITTGGQSYTVGVLVQTNFGGVLRINGVLVLDLIGRSSPESKSEPGIEGSCMIVVATDAPLDARNLKRLAKRACLGIARSGGFNSNGSGDYAVAFSTAAEVRVANQSASPLQTITVVRNDHVSALFQAAAEAAEEAILNSLFKAVRIEGREGHVAEPLPIEKLKSLVTREEKK